MASVLRTKHPTIYLPNRHRDVTSELHELLVDDLKHRGRSDAEIQAMASRR